MTSTLSSFLAPSTGPLTMQQFVDTYLNPALKAAGLTAPQSISGATYTVGSSDTDLIIAATVAMSLTLPASSLNLGRVLNVKTLAQAINSTAANVYPIGTTVLGTVICSSVAGKWAHLKADGTNWVVMASN